MTTAVALAWAGLNWSRVRRAGTSFFKGEARAALEERVRRFDRALEFGNLETLGNMLASGRVRAVVIGAAVIHEAVIGELVDGLFNLGNQ